MNKVIECIKNRRSTRKYLDKKVDDSYIKKVIEAGSWAPSGHNKQPWYFTVINNRNVINDLNCICKKSMLEDANHESVKSIARNSKYNIFHNAPTVIIVSFENNGITEEADCCAAIQNILLAAESIGLGTCWIGYVKYYFQSKNFKSAQFKIPYNFTPYYAVAIGYREETDKLNPPKRRENNISYIN